MRIRKILPIILAVLFLYGCKGEAELAMERGIQYYEWNLVDKAILEFNRVVHMLSVTPHERDYKKIQLLARAHHNLSVSYAKKKWYNDAEKEARTAFDLYPSAENRTVLELIQKKQTTNKESSPAKGEPNQ